MVFPVVENHLPANTNVATDVEHHAIILTGMNVELVPDASLAGTIPLTQRKFFYPSGAGRLEPLAEVAFGVEVIPRAMAVAIAKVTSAGVGNSLPLVIAKVSPVGDYGSTHDRRRTGGLSDRGLRCLPVGGAGRLPAGRLRPDRGEGRRSCFPAYKIQAITCCVASG